MPSIPIHNDTELGITEMRIAFTSLKNGITYISSIDNALCESL